MITSVVMQRLLGTEDFFPGKPVESFEHYGRQLGTEFIQKFIAHQLSLFKVERRSDDIIITEWFSQHKTSLRKKAVDRITYLASDPSKRVALLSVEALLNMFIWSMSADIPEKVEVGPDSEAHLFFLTLAFNDEHLKKYELPPQFMAKTSRPPQHGMLAMTFSNSDLINVDYAQLIYGQFYRAIALLEFMERNADFHKLLNKLFETFDITSKEGYIKAIGAAVLPLFKSITPSTTTIQLPTDAEHEKSQKILRQLASTDLISPGLDDYLEMRSKPFQEISEDKYRVIFDLFQVKMIYTGLYFRLLGFVQEDPSLFPKDYSGTFKAEFSEGTLVYQVLNKIFNRPDVIKVTGAEFKPLTVEPDYYARAANSIFLFESKDFFIPGVVKASYDFPAIEAELKKRLHFDRNPKTGDEKNGAVRQLACNVSRVLEKAFLQDKSYDLGKIKIYPCVIVHDSVLNAPGLNYLVNDWFNEEMQTVINDPRLAGFDFSRVMPVTIIDIDTLILLQEGFQANPEGLGSLLDAFHAHVQLNHRGGFKDMEEMELHVYDSVLPFSEFARTAVDRNALLLAISALLQKFRELGIPE